MIFDWNWMIEFYFTRIQAVDGPRGFKSFNVEMLQGVCEQQTICGQFCSISNWFFWEMINPRGLFGD